MADKRWLVFAGIFSLCLFAFGQEQGAEPSAESASETTFEFDPEHDSPGQAVPPAGELNYYYIDRSGDEPRFIQRIIWEKSEFVLRYEVIVQELKPNGSISEVERVVVEEAYVELSLFAGKYRYCLDVYDLLDEYVFTTEWREFDIIRALQPELYSFSPQSFFLDEDDTWEIALRGLNLIPESEIYLVDNDVKVIPLRRIGEGESVRLVFSEISLIPGKYSVYARNPGGLDAYLGTFSISFRKPFDFNFSLGYAPLVPLYGYLFKDFTQEAPFVDSFYPLGAVARISFIPFKRVWGYLGAELSGSFAYLEHEREFYTSIGFLLNTHISLIYQRYFFKKAFSLNASAGLGTVSLLNFHYEYPIGPPTEDKSNIFPSFLIGVSGTVFVFKPMFIGIGADYIHVFSEDSPMPGFITPYVTIGVQL